MAKEAEFIDQFIELRGQGLSYQKISELLGVSKTTLIGWGKKHRESVAEAQALEIQAVLDRLGVNRMNRVEAFAQFQQALQKELLSRIAKNEFTLSDEKLLAMTLTTEARLERELGTAALNYHEVKDFELGDEQQLRLD